MTIIAAITKDLALGRNGDMIYHISADLRRFKRLTMGHPLVMGRRTFESFPNGPLPGRRNIVVTRNPSYAHSGIEVCPTLEAALQSGGPDSIVIGGGQIYAQALHLADTLEITEIDAIAPDADAHFPPIPPSEWTVIKADAWQEDPRSGVRFRYVTYKR